jgi:hypothetical protein
MINDVGDLLASSKKWKLAKMEMVIPAALPVHGIKANLHYWHQGIENMQI